jgi:heterodisulfide reductase subunit C
MDSTPRRLLALISAGLKEEALSSTMPWKCVSCYLCTSRCPQNVPVTEIMATLKRMSVRGGCSADRDAQALASTFASFVERFGRSFEFGLASRFYMTRRPASMRRLGPLGLSMVRHGRISLRPERIREIAELRSIIRKARELGGES